MHRDLRSSSARQVWRGLAHECMGKLKNYTKRSVNFWSSKRTRYQRFPCEPAVSQTRAPTACCARSGSRSRTGLRLSGGLGWSSVPHQAASGSRRAVDEKNLATIHGVSTIRCCTAKLKPTLLFDRKHPMKIFSKHLLALAVAVAAGAAQAA